MTGFLQEYDHPVWCKYSAEQIMWRLDRNEVFRRADFDGVVNVTDLPDLLAAWGACP